MTWLNEKMKECHHHFDKGERNMGSVGGMCGITFPDGSSRFPLVFVECKKCGYAYVSYELMGGQKVSEAEMDTIDLINSFHNIRYDKIKDKQKP